MLKKLSHIILLLLSILVIGCGGDGEKRAKASQSADTLNTAEAAMRVYDENPELALEIIDSGVAVGNIEEDLATFLRAKVYTQSTSMQEPDTARQMLESLLKKPYVTESPSNHEMVLDLLITVSRLRDDNVQYMRWATEKVDLCRQQNLETEALRTEAEIGLLLTQMGEEEKGLAKLDGIIATLIGQRHFDEADACIIALKRKINALYSLKRPAEAIPLAQRIIAKTDDYREHYADYADGSYRMPGNKEDVDDYCNFYSAQAHGYLARSYAEMANKQLAASGQQVTGSNPNAQSYQQPAKKYLDSARYHLALYEKSSYGQSEDGQVAIAPTLGLLGDYDRMLTIFDRLEKELGDDTLTSQYAIILKGRARAASARGDYRAANGYWKRFSALNDRLNTQLLKGRAYEYATRYHLQEEQLKAENERQNAETNRRASLAHLVLAMVILALCIWLALSRVSAGRRNKLLVSQIAEAVEYKNIVETQKAEESKEPQWENEPADLELPKAENNRFRGMTDDEIYEFLCMAIRNEKLFTDPNFSRQTLTELYGINDHHIGAIFSNGNGLNDYIREIRVEYACWLFNNKPEMTISEVAVACGFSSLPVFSREFKRKLEVTPSYYRSLL